jgi:zinc-ribbon family
MLLIWGWRTRFKTLVEGVFHCPGCGGDRHYAHKEARNWFTLFFLPVIPLKVQGEFVECQTCRQGYDLRILRLPTSAALTEQLVAATREAAVQLLRVDDTPSGRTAAVVALSQVSDMPWSEEALAADVQGLDASALPARLRQLGEVMNEQGKERFLWSIATIAAGGGVLAEPSRQTLTAMAVDLGMTPAHARGVIEQALDPSTR